MADPYLLDPTKEIVLNDPALTVIDWEASGWKQN